MTFLPASPDSALGPAELFGARQLGRVVKLLGGRTSSLVFRVAETHWQVLRGHACQVEGGQDRPGADRPLLGIIHLVRRLSAVALDWRCHQEPLVPRTRRRDGPMAIA